MGRANLDSTVATQTPDPDTSDEVYTVVMKSKRDNGQGEELCIS